MAILTLTLAIFGTSILAGLLGALTGLGGGVVVVPVLALLFHVDLRYAIGASLVSVIATSSGSAAAFVREGFSNIRIGMFLEIATTVGALFGAFLATSTSTKAIAIVFGLVLLYSAIMSLRRRRIRKRKEQTDALAVRLRLDGTYPIAGKKTPYHV